MDHDQSVLISLKW